MKLCETQVRLNPGCVQLESLVQLLESLVLLLLGEEYATHQNVAFDVLRIFLENFFGESFRFGNDVRAIAAAGEIVGAESEAGVEIAFVESYSLAQLIEHFRKALEPFIGAR